MAVARLGRQRQRYCSIHCRREHYRRRIIALWQAGRLPPRLYFNRVIRRFVIDAIGERCEECGWNERNPHTGRVPLEIEHIDEDWRNNAPRNIRVLCPNCHALTPTFRGANRGRGRPAQARRRSRLGACRATVSYVGEFVGSFTIFTACG